MNLLVQAKAFSFTFIIFVPPHSIGAEPPAPAGCANADVLWEASVRADCQSSQSWIRCGLSDQVIIGTGIFTGSLAASGLKPPRDTTKLTGLVKNQKNPRLLIAQLQNLGISAKDIETYLNLQKERKAAFMNKEKAYLEYESAHLRSYSDQGRTKSSLSQELAEKKRTYELHTQKYRASLENIESFSGRIKVKHLAQNSVRAGALALGGTLAAQESAKIAAIKTCLNPASSESLLSLQRYIRTASLSECKLEIPGDSINDLMELSISERSELMKSNPSLCKLLLSQIQKQKKQSAVGKDAKVEVVSCSETDIQLKMKVNGKTYEPKISKGPKNYIEIKGAFFPGPLDSLNSNRKFTASFYSNTGTPGYIDTSYPQVSFANSLEIDGTQTNPLYNYMRAYQQGQCRYPDLKMEKGDSYFGNLKYELGCAAASQMTVVKEQLPYIIGKCDELQKKSVLTPEHEANSISSAEKGTQ
ncbi:hypothetical protein [Bdellovibrio bacteriovorus]|uniref:Uncharacterized protein n=1 Tax=Bdellovibrio bacteriovorus str. Tiberius TaxID=1069642 RepID=K7YVR5_BDEBC|nr:hypothetical protein [Bdellovibrio bacteriovorus]AFY00785.1 Hypothetical protein Bdt_1085 [Bdellovibrio bacteriovorus str. Tiberius]